jgi:hypothetical protein
MSTTAAERIAQEVLAKPASMTGDPAQKLGWIIDGLKNDLEGAMDLRDALPLMSPAARQYVVNLLQRGMR